MEIKISKKGNKIVLDQLDVERIVLEWYTNGMIPDVLQNEDGFDLEEVLIDGYNKDFKCKTITNKKK